MDEKTGVIHQDIPLQKDMGSLGIKCGGRGIAEELIHIFLNKNLYVSVTLKQQNMSPFLFASIIVVINTQL